uniref:Uncharacterized protein n=1 Tax=Arundo donax TaxID=35708 RepID=A0A0A9CC42_ARUDO
MMLASSASCVVVSIMLVSHDLVQRQKQLQDTLQELVL